MPEYTSSNPFSQMFEVLMFAIQRGEWGAALFIIILIVAITCLIRYLVVNRLM